MSKQTVWVTLLALASSSRKLASFPVKYRVFITRTLGGSWRSYKWSYKSRNFGYNSYPTYKPTDKGVSENRGPYIVP